MIETVKDKLQYERLTVGGNKSDLGWYSESYGLVTFERIVELKEVQTALTTARMDIALKEAEYWSSYCTDVLCASLATLPTSPPGIADFIAYAKRFFKTGISVVGP